MEMECGYNIGGLKCPLAAINREIDNSRLRYLPGCHDMVELDDHPRVEGPVRGHKRLQGVPLHKPHGISELRIGSWKIIICLAVHFPCTAIEISYNGVVMEEGSSYNRSRRQIRGDVISWPLNMW